MEETYNRIRLELKAVEEMMLRTKEHNARVRLGERRKALRAESHEILKIVQAQQLALKLEAQTKDRAALLHQRAEFAKDLHGVMTDFLPGRLRKWLSREALRRQRGEDAYQPGCLQFWLVLVGLK